MEILAFILCFVVFGFFIITTDFKQNKITNIFFVVLCSVIIVFIGSVALYSLSNPTPEPYKFESSGYVAPTENPLNKIDNRLSQIERKLK